MNRCSGVSLVDFGLARLRGFDSSILQLEPRMATIESQMPRLQEASKMTSVLNSEAVAASISSDFD